MLTVSLCCTEEMNTVLQINYTSIKLKIYLYESVVFPDVSSFEALWDLLLPTVKKLSTC